MTRLWDHLYYYHITEETRKYQMIRDFAVDIILIFCMNARKTGIDVTWLLMELHSRKILFQEFFLNWSN